MITPMTEQGDIDYDGAARLAAYLVDDMRNDGLVISGTTGESPTTTDAEKERLLKAVIGAVGDRPASWQAWARTTPPTRSSWPVRPSGRAPTGCSSSPRTTTSRRRTGCIAHFTAVADATGLPVLLYDIPGRTGVPIATETLLRLAEHPRIVARQGRQGRPGRHVAGCWPGTDWPTTAATDMLNLPWLSLGAVGFVSVVGHVVGDRLHEMIDAYAAGESAGPARSTASCCRCTPGCSGTRA